MEIVDAASKINTLDVGWLITVIVGAVISAGVVVALIQNFLFAKWFKKFEQKLEYSNEVFRYKFTRQKEAEEKLMRLAVVAHTSLFNFSLANLNNYKEVEQAHKAVSNDIEEYRMHLRQSRSYLDDDERQAAGELHDALLTTSRDILMYWRYRYAIKRPKKPDAERLSKDREVLREIISRQTTGFSSIGDQYVKLSSIVKEKIEHAASAHKET